MFLAMVVAVAVQQIPGDLSKAAGCNEDDAPCLLSGDWKAGNDGAGAPLRVVHLTRGTRSTNNGECNVEEYWVLTGAKAPRTAKLFLQLCNDGYGSASVGEDEVTVKPNRLFHDQFGGSDGRWSVSREFQLSPPVLLTSTVSTFVAASPQFTDEVRWSWDTFSGERTRLFSRCTEEGQADLREEIKPKPVKAQVIPKVAVTKEFVQGQWKTTSLGTCAAKASTVWQGALGNDADGSLKVLAISDTEFIVEVTDDVWANGDQLRLWLGDHPVPPHEGCLGADISPASQWLVELPSGNARPGQNARFGVPGVELVQSGQAVRFRLKLPEGIWPSVSFGYADSDDGKVIERVVGTSQIVPPQTATLGSLWLIDRKQAICDITDNVLTPKRASSLPTKGPLFPGSTKGK
ncbi:MAG: hypothetical protein U0228_24595 [Myxococcaceae bacterium]